MRLLVYSSDTFFPRLLGSALPAECQVIAELNRSRLKEAAWGAQADVLVLDLDSKQATLAEHLKLYDDVASVGPPIIVATDFVRHETSEFYRRGAFDCVPKPTPLEDLHRSVRRAYERAMM